MQQIAGRQRFWWRAQDAQTSGPGAAFRERYLSYPEETARAVGAGRPKTAPKRRAMALQIPRGERRYRGPKRHQRRWMKPLFALGALALLTGVAAVAVPLDEVRKIDFGNAVGTKASDAMIAAGFGLDQVNVSGQHYAADSDIFDALDLPNVRTFAAFDSEAALKRIERISWIDTAQITRVYPGTLDIVVHERTPAVLWTRGTTNYLVDASGRVLGPTTASSGWALPRVVGEGAGGEAVLMLAALRQYPSIERDYAYAERIAERRWRIVLRNGTALELGADREIEGLEEISEARAVAPALKGKAMIVDVRTPGRIAVRPVDGTLAPSAKPDKTAALETPLAGDSASADRQ